MLTKTKVGQRVIGNQIDDRRYAMPEGWGSGKEVKKVIDPTEEPMSTMLVIEPDKALNLKPAVCTVHTYIREFKRTEELMHALQDLSAGELEDLLGCKPKIAKSHQERFNSFEKLSSKQALLMLGGDPLGAADFDSKETDFAGRHIRMITGLYGLLRPYDDVKPVRDVPFGAKLETDKGKFLSEFWGDAITKMLVKDIAELVKGKEKGRCLLVANTSEEYWKAVNVGSLPKTVRVVQIEFEGANEEYTRKARSYFSRYIVKKKVDTVEGLTEFSHDDWQFEKTRSRDAMLLFVWDGDTTGAAKKKKVEEVKKKEKIVDAGGFVAGYCSDSDNSAGGEKLAAPGDAGSDAGSSDASRRKKTKKKQKKSAASDGSDGGADEKGKKKKSSGRARSRSRSRRRTRRRSRS